LSGPLSFFLIFIIFTVVVLTFQLGSRPASLSVSESDTIKQTLGIHQIIDNPINAPYNLFLYLVHHLSSNSVFLIRLPSVILALVLVLFFYKLSKAWFGKTIALLGSVIFATTPIFLISARQVSTGVMFFSLISIMYLYFWLSKSEEKNQLAFIIMLSVSALLLYTPGFIWWFIAAVILSWSGLSEYASEISKKALFIAFLLFLIIITPLVFESIKDWRIIQQLALVPTHFMSPFDILKNIGWMASALFIKTPYHSLLLVDRLPIFGLVQLALIIFGSFAMWTSARAKLLLMLSNIGLSVVVAGINNDLALLALGVPAAVLLMCAGLRYLYIEWKNVFPFNPIAKSLAIMLLLIVTLVQLSFGLRYSLIVWPHSLGTKANSVIK
jgi:4-amino-4-deoxy-L-arabinose transferase-like glycosyltransferase